MYQILKFKNKILLALLLTGILSLSVTGWQSYRIAKNALKKKSFESLTAIRETKKRQIETYFKQIRDQITTFSENRMIIEAISCTAFLRRSILPLAF